MQLRLPDSQKVSAWGPLIRWTKVDPPRIFRTSPLECISLVSSYRLPPAISPNILYMVLLPLDLCPCVNGLRFPVASQS